MITYASLIGPSERAGRWQLALELFDRMQGERVSPNTITFNSVMNACAKGMATSVFDHRQESKPLRQPLLEPLPPPLPPKTLFNQTWPWLVHSLSLEL